jgi:hypothetical protein
MKLNILYIAISLSCGYLLSSCTDNIVDEPSDFNVSIDTLKTYKTGDTLEFKIAGGFADQIVFFSGEKGKEFANLNRKSVAGAPKLVFQSSIGQGNINDHESLRLMISSNLNGYDSTAVVNATWTDITDRAKWPSSISSSFTVSDSINLSDFNSSEKINIAFRYRGLKAIQAVQSKWQISNLSLTNILMDGTNVPLFSTFDNTGWAQVSLKNLAIAWNVGTWGVSANTSLTNTSGITITKVYPIEINPGSVYDVADNEDWLVLKGQWTSYRST